MRPLVFAFALFAAFSGTFPAAAQSERAAAVALFDEGREALQRGDLEVACAKFQESNRLDPAIGTAFNLANCEEQLGRLSTAWVLFRQVAGRMKSDDPRLATANQRIASLNKRVPRVIFSSDSRTPTNTRVRLDDLELAAQSFGSAIPLDPGPHHAVVRSPGSPPRTSTFTIYEGETLTLPLNPVGQRAAASAQGKPHPSAPAEADDRVAGLKRSDALLATGAVGIAGIVVGAVTGIVGLNAQSAGNDGCSATTKTCSQEGHDANQRAKTLAVVSSVGFIVGLLGGGAATYLYLTAPTGQASDQAAIVGVRGRW